MLKDPAAMLLRFFIVTHAHKQDPAAEPFQRFLHIPQGADLVMSLLQHIK